MIEADTCSDRLRLFGRFHASTPAAIEAGVDARGRAALMLRGPAKAPTNVTPETSQR
jgi:hypothetical protein